MDWALPQQRSYVIGLDRQALVVAGYAGRKDELPHALSVQPRFIKAVSRDIQPRGLHSFAKHEAPAQITGGLMRFGIALQLRVDPPRGVVALFQKPHLKKSFLAPGPLFAVFIPEAYLPADLIPAF